MEIKPLPKWLFDELKDNKYSRLKLAFQGGSDEGYLDISVHDPVAGWMHPDREFLNLIEDWAWSAYQYSGAGDGVDYGDVIEYILDGKRPRATHQDWTMERLYGGKSESDLVISEPSETEMSS